jgi:hypothetical protein
LLADWHNAGCKTVEECLTRYEEVKRLRTEEEATKRETSGAKPKRARAEQKQKPRYGDFDPEAALKMALSRSFFDENSDGDK